MAVTKKQKNPKNHSVKDILEWKFDEVELDQLWKDHLGDIPKGAKILVKGDAKNGKTEYLVRMCCAFMESSLKVNFNSPEQGKSKSFQNAAIRNNLAQYMGLGKFIFCEKSQRAFENWFRRLCQPNSGNVCVLDSADYMNLTVEQMKLLFERFPNKIIIIVSWKANPNLKKFEHLVDAIIDVKDFKASPVGRFGGWKELIIWDKKGPKHLNNQLTLL
ncbi:hypothetical protein [Sphingobacterium spiritivorum]|uniref:hypothetical protein n=2 Tax=Sphingobacterium spiritivorum TaxID=258 RepID=UPI003DA4AE9B